MKATSHKWELVDVIDSYILDGIEIQIILQNVSVKGEKGIFRWADWSEEKGILEFGPISFNCSDAIAQAEARAIEKSSLDF